MTETTAQKLALVITLIITVLLVKNLIVNVFEAPALPAERVVPLLQY